MALSLQEQRYYEEVLATLSSPGWQFLCEDFEEHKKVYSDLRHCVDQRDLDYRKGRLERVEYLLGLKAVFEMAYEQAQADADADAQGEADAAL
jgi:hypothetical protein